MKKENKKSMQASPENLEEALIKVSHRSKAGDNVFIYLDGHGDQGELNRPETNAIYFKEKSMEYVRLSKVIEDWLPGRQVIFFNLLCFGGGNHQTAIDLRNVSVLANGNYLNSCGGSWFIRGFFQSLKQNPEASLAAAYWHSRLLDSRNADFAGISSEIYLDQALGEGDYSSIHKDSMKRGESLELLIKRVRSLGGVISRIETLHRNNAFVNASELLPKELIKDDQLTIQQINWLQNVCGSVEWKRNKLYYEECLKEYENKFKKWAKRKKSDQRLTKRFETLQEYRSGLCQVYYCLVLACDIMEKIDRLQLLFESVDFKDKQAKYLDLVRRENKPVFNQSAKH